MDFRNYSTHLIRLVGILFFIIIFAGCSQNSNKDKTKLPSDQAIAETLINQLEQTTAIPAKNIQVNSKEGIVRLSGSTPNLLAKQKATEITKNEFGVLSVVNNLKVTADRPDKAIQQDVVRALSTDPATESWEISASVNNGLVTLKGNVDSWQEKKLAGTIASGVRGVTEVTNLIQVSTNKARDDSEIEAEITKALTFDSRIRDNLIEVSVENDTVRLSGSVGSATEKQLAMEAARVTGVEAVHTDSLEVHPEYNNQRFINKTVASLTTSQIKDAIQKSFTYDPRVPAEHIEVTVEDNTAVLSGNVLNLSSKLAAEEDVRNTSGINNVENNITVERKVVVEPKIPTTDEAIKSRIKNSILRDPYVHKTSISINVSKGIVELSGSVNSEFEKKQIHEITSKVKGVMDVNNNLRVEPGNNETS